MSAETMRGHWVKLRIAVDVDVNQASGGDNSPQQQSSNCIQREREHQNKQLHNYHQVSSQHHLFCNLNHVISLSGKILQRKVIMTMIGFIVLKNTDSY
jgi:hypothetical protein